MRATSSGSWPSSPGLILPGASPSSPLVQVTSTVRTPCAEYRARVPPVLFDSSSGCAWTAISVSFSMRTACPTAVDEPNDSGATAESTLTGDVVDDLASEQAFVDRAYASLAAMQARTRHVFDRIMATGGFQDLDHEVAIRRR